MSLVTTSHHTSVEEKSDGFKCRCLEVVSKAADFAKQLAEKDDDTKAGSSIHIWLSFSEFVSCSKDGVNSKFIFDESVTHDIVFAFANLICDSCAPVFVSLCTNSSFFHGDEMHMERVIENRIPLELSKVGVPVSHNQAMWSECANFIDSIARCPQPKAFIFIKGVFIFTKGSLKNFVFSTILVRDHALSTIVF